ncbi:MAG: hypothetical protein ACRDOM_08055 [Nocardioides sp.]
MPRRVSLPAADDLFRKTGGQDTSHVRAVPGGGEDEGEHDRNGPKKPSGRVRHDEKMTVYITSDELLDLEHARLALRRSQGLAVDRGRLVREAVALVLADYETHGDDSVLVRRLTEE